MELGTIIEELEHKIAHSYQKGNVMIRTHCGDVFNKSIEQLSEKYGVFYALGARWIAVEEYEYSRTDKDGNDIVALSAITHDYYDKYEDEDLYLHCIFEFEYIDDGSNEHDEDFAPINFERPLSAYICTSERDGDVEGTIDLVQIIQLSMYTYME